ncbi:Diphthamide biosynthesis protein 4 [Grifola frondosa]|uniref:Diphthamide biosynthesis protein 4 n=1 Tax=Grifola frondosa TaxID=5627 RepID=A0A1C7MNH6_GRIFR|nr:Diphthamide biosynthesis protein 4 [Grifola frondosa]
MSILSFSKHSPGEWNHFSYTTIGPSKPPSGYASLDNLDSLVAPCGSFQVAKKGEVQYNLYKYILSRGPVWRLLVHHVVKLDTFDVPDYYALLCISPTATFSEIKTAYHHTLLLSHPDKHEKTRSHADIDIGALKDAYLTLSSPDRRAKYDATRSNAATRQSGPRPAQVVSLEDFDPNSEVAGPGAWKFPCRCGGSYTITEEQMEAGQHLVGCHTCSETVWVGFELADDTTEIQQTIMRKP